MSKYKIIAIYIFIILFLGACNAKKKVISTSVSTERESISYVLPSNNELTINELCDTLKIKSPMVIQNDDGVVDIRLELKDNTLKVKTEYDTIYKDRYIEKEVIKTKESETVKYKWAKITWAFLGVIILFCIFPGIPRAINTIAIKLIRGF